MCFWPLMAYFYRHFSANYLLVILSYTSLTIPNAPLPNTYLISKSWIWYFLSSYCLRPILKGWGDSAEISFLRPPVLEKYSGFLIKSFLSGLLKGDLDSFVLLKLDAV